MKTAKLILGIIGIVLSIVIVLTSCTAGFAEALAGDGSSGASGVFAAVFMMIASIIGVCTRNSRGGGITAGAFFAISGIVGITSSGVYKDLIVWSVISLAFAAVFIVCSLKMPKKEDAAGSDGSIADETDKGESGK